MFKFEDDNHIIQLWNEYCVEHEYLDDVIHYVDSIESFIKDWYSEDGKTVPINKVRVIACEISDYRGQQYFHFARGNVCWFDEISEDDDDCPILWGAFDNWLCKNYPELQGEE